MDDYIINLFSTYADLLLLMLFMLIDCRGKWNL